MPRHTFDLTLSTEFSDREFQVTAEYSYYPAYHGARDGRYGAQLEPDEPACVIVNSLYARRWVYDAGQKKHVLSSEPEIECQAWFDREALEAAILAEHEGEIEAARENYLEQRADDAREQRRAAQ